MEFDAKMTAAAAEIDRTIAKKRWAAYPLLVGAVKDMLVTFSHSSATEDDFKLVDRAVQLLILLGEQEQKVPSCCLGEGGNHGI